MSATRILYVDDEPDIREVAELSLQLDPDLDVRTCDNGEDALALARSWAPHLILLDVMMPHMDGPATLAGLRGHPETAAIPVAFITARAQSADTRRLIELGAVGVIPKPFDPLTLAQEAKRLLGGGEPA